MNIKINDLSVVEKKSTEIEILDDLKTLEVKGGASGNIPANLIPLNQAMQNLMQKLVQAQK
jgi:hypothetical protein